MAISTGTVTSIKSEMLSVGLDPATFDLFVSALTTAGVEIADSATKDPVEVVGVLPATISAVAGMPGLFVVAITLGDGSTVQALRSQDADGKWSNLWAGNVAAP